MRVLGWLLVLWLGACREVPAYSPESESELGSPARRAEPRAPVAKGKTTRAVAGPRVFGAVWSQQTPPFHESLAIAPSGQVAVLSTRSLSIHDRKTGGMLARRDVCDTFAGAFGFVDDKTGALVCDDGVRLFSLPDLAYRGMHALPDKAEGASFAPGLVALSFGAGPVRVFDTASWTEKKSFTADDEVTALAVNDKELAIGLEGGEVLVYRVDGTAAQRIAIEHGLEVEAVALSPDGARVFASAGPIAGVWRTRDGALERRFETVGAVTAARWLGNTDLAVVGPDGLLLLHGRDGSVGSVDGGGLLGSAPPIGLAASEDSLVVCAGERDGKVACFSRGRLPATRPLPLDLDPASQYGEVMAGRVLGWNDGRLRVVALPRTAVPKPGTDVVLLTYHERQIGTLRTARWTRLAEGRVFKIDKDVVFVRLDGELTPLEGVKDPLARDAPLRLAWHPRYE